MLASTLTKPSPLLNLPASSMLKSISRDVIWAEFMTWPIRMKSGKLISAYELNPASKRSGNISKSWVSLKTT